MVYLLSLLIAELQPIAVLVDNGQSLQRIVCAEGNSQCHVLPLTAVLRFAFTPQFLAFFTVMEQVKTLMAPEDPESED